MLLTISSSWLPPLSSQKATSPFLNGCSPIHLLQKPSSSVSLSRPSFLPPIRAMKQMQGRVVCAASDKTVAVEVTRLAPHPKYKRRIKHKKKYQAHDAENQFKVGDVVQLEKSRPISKTKTFIALALPPRNRPPPPQDLGIPLDSAQLE